MAKTISRRLIESKIYDIRGHKVMLDADSATRHIAFESIHGYCSFTMSTAKKIENAIKELEPEDCKAFRNWFDEYESRMWDAQIERDVRSGKLAQLAHEAIEEHKDERTSEI